jgi:transcriptional regulator with XRE-family HTH domain
MNHYGVVLKKLRELNQLTVKQAAQKIGRSSGWISQIENGKGAARLNAIEFERVVAAYNGESYRKQFGAWISRSKIQEQMPHEISFEGYILKYLRRNAGLTVQQGARKAGLSKGHLFDLENGIKRLSGELRNKLMRINGYSPASFRNFTDADKRAKNIPTRYKLNLLLGKLSEFEVEKVFAFAFERAGTQLRK